MALSNRRREITRPKPEKEPKEKTFRVIDMVKAGILVVVFVALAALLIVNRDNLTLENARVLLSYLDFSGNKGALTSIDTAAFASNRDNAYAVYKNKFAVMGVDGLRLYGGKSDEPDFYAVKAENPVLLSSDKLLMQFDVGKNYINLFNTGGLVKNIVYDYPISAAAISNTGAFAVARAERGYKGKVTVYNRNMNESFNSYSGENYITNIALSDNNRLCVATVSTAGGILSANLIVYDTTQEEPLAQKSYESELFADVQFKDNNLLLAVSDSEMVFLDGKGNEKAIYRFDAGYLWNYSLAPRRYNVVAMAQNTLGSDITIEILDNSGTKVASYAVGEAVKDMKAGDKGIAVLTGSKLLQLDFEGTLVNEMKVSPNAQELLMGNDGVYLISPGKAEYIDFK